MEGIILLNKQKGISSAKAVEKVKRITGAKKAGHGGTLDVLAQGLLVIALGTKYTKILDKLLKDSPKEYIVSIELGKFSITDDEEGEKITVEGNIPTIQEIEKILKEKFTGKIEQIPPIFSALKIQGKRMYNIAREYLKEGKNLSEIQTMPQKRETEIYKIEILNYEYPILTLKVNCSSGTYIRALARDIGKELKTGGYVKELTRTAIGEFKLERALKIEDLENNVVEMLARVYGRVQGVGFRAFTKKWADFYGIKGYAKNMEDGSVEVIAQGKLEELKKLSEKIKQGSSLSKAEETEFYFMNPLKHFPDFYTL